MKAKLLLSFIFSFCISLSLHAASDKYNVAFYDKWEKVPDEELLATGARLQSKGEPDSAMVCYSVIVNRYHENNNSNKMKALAAKAMFGIGYIYMYYFYNYEQAYNFMQQSRELSEQEGFSENLPYIYLNLGNITFLSMQMWQNANIEKNVLPIYRKALTYAKDTKYWEAYVIIIGNILELAFESKHPQYYLDIIKEFKNSNIPSTTPRFHHVLYECSAFKSYIKGDYKRALLLLDKSASHIDNSLSMERCIMRILKHKGNIYTAIRQYDNAYKELAAAMQLASKKKVRDAEVEFCTLLYKLCLKSGNKEKAHEWQFLFYQKKDSLMSQSHIGNIEHIMFLNKMGKINQQVMEMTQKRKIEHVIICALFFIAALTITFSCALVKQNRKLKERNHLIYLNNQEAIRREKEERRKRNEMQKELAKLEKGCDNAEYEKKQKYQGSSLSEEEKQRLNEELLQIFENVDEICSDSFSVNRLAELTNSTYKNISQVINELHEKSFKQIVSTYRIREACHRLSDKEHYGNLTIEGIAYSVGFKSRSSFVQAFKRIVGISPSEYQKEANMS